MKLEHHLNTLIVLMMGLGILENKLSSAPRKNVAVSIQFEDLISQCFADIFLSWYADFE